MRVISGKFKGRHLVPFKGDHIRPTTDRVKETQFNILQGLTEGAKVLDLFAGTGNLGIEAISRGAAHVDFVELSRASIQVIKKNLESLGIKEGFSIIQKDVLKFLAAKDLETYDIIFVDPPFTKVMAHEVLEQISLAVGEGLLFNEDTLLTIESASKERLELKYENLHCTNQRIFGDKKLSFFKKGNGPSTDGEQKTVQKSE